MLYKVLNFIILLKIKFFTKIFYRPRRKWVGDALDERTAWRDIRVVCFLNHTSLYEPLFAATIPNHFIWDICKRGVVPVAAKTLDRPIVGRMFKALVPHPVSISREPDHTWDAVLRGIGDDTMALILPEGRMRRRNGLDSHGKLMTSRGGIADILKVVREGKMLMAYAGGLHHVQIPGQHLPKFFRTIRMDFEIVDIAKYRKAMGAGTGERAFKNAVKADLDRRRDLYSPWHEESTRQPEGIELPKRPERGLAPQDALLSWHPDPSG